MSQSSRMWRVSLLCSAVMAVAACGGGDDSPSPAPAPTPAPSPTPTPPPAALPATADLLPKYAAAAEALTATSVPATGEERSKLRDGCLLTQGRTKAMLVADWDANRAQAQANDAYVIGRKISNIQVLAERNITNSDGSLRREVDVSFDDAYADGTKALGVTDTLIVGSSKDSCDTPQTGNELRAFGNRFKVSASVTSRTLVQVTRSIANGDPSGSPSLRREMRFNVSDPAQVASYAVISWTAPSGAKSLKLLSPRIARTAPEMQTVRGAANYLDSDNFRICRSDNSNTVANAALADCTQFGMGANSWGNPAVTDLSDASLKAADATFAAEAGTQFTVQVFADEGWKSVNGQNGKTPIATYTVTRKQEPYELARLGVDNYPQFLTISPDAAAIAAAFKGNGGTLSATLQAATPPSGGLPVAMTTLYSFRQGPKDGAANGLPLVRTPSLNGTASADGKSATIPFGGKPEGASRTSYGEFGLAYNDRNGRDIAYLFVFQ